MSLQLKEATQLVARHTQHCSVALARLNTVQLQYTVLQCTDSVEASA